MSDWADEKAKLIYARNAFMTVDTSAEIAAALRSAHIKGLMEAREIAEECGQFWSLADLPAEARRAARIACDSVVTDIDSRITALQGKQEKT